MQFLKYKSTRGAITRPLGNTPWIAHQYLLLLYDTKTRFIHSLPKLPRMCTLNTAVVEKRWIIKLGLLGLSLWFDSACLSFTQKYLTFYEECYRCFSRSGHKKWGQRGEDHPNGATWLRESKSPWGVTARSVGQDDKGCPILTGHVSATEVNLKVSGVWLLKVVSMLNVAIKRWVTFEIVLKKTKTKIESNS